MMAAAGSTRAFAIREPAAYADALAVQERLVAERVAGDCPDTVLFLEHRPVVTLGSRGSTTYLLHDREALEARGIELHHASRGGDVTYHAPGQLIMYPILHLGTKEADSHGYLCNLEEVAIRTAGTLGIPAERRKGMTGAWTASGKIAAIGVRLRKWVTFHGMSFNVDLDLEGFQLIVPCGLEGEGVTSVRQILGEEAPGLPAVRTAMLEHFQEVCGRKIDHLETLDTIADVP